MNKASLLSLGLGVALSLVSVVAMAAPGQTLQVEFQGPGGHSNGNYGRTSAVHAAARSIMRLQHADMPAQSWWLSDFNGGNSVNSIASDARFTVHLKAANEGGYDQLADTVKAAVAAGVEAENAFRGIDVGDRVHGNSGARADIRYTIKRSRP